MKRRTGRQARRQRLQPEGREGRGRLNSQKVVQRLLPQGRTERAVARHIRGRGRRRRNNRCRKAVKKKRLHLRRAPADTDGVPEHIVDAAGVLVSAWVFARDPAGRRSSAAPQTPRGRRHPSSGAAAMMSKMALNSPVSSVSVTPNVTTV